MSEAARRRRYSTALGYLTALCGPVVLFPEKQPTAYSYNGVVLPKLPEWDKTVYPYAVIYYQKNKVISTNQSYEAVFLQHPGTVNGDFGTARLKHIYLPEETAALGRSLESPVMDNDWNELHDESISTNNGEPYISIGDTAAQKFEMVWSNFPIRYRTANDDAGIAVGDIYLAASEPIPVYE